MGPSMRASNLYALRQEPGVMLQAENHDNYAKPYIPYLDVDMRASTSLASTNGFILSAAGMKVYSKLSVLSRQRARPSLGS